LYSVCAAIVQRLRSDSSAIAQQSLSNYAAITERLRSDYAAITLRHLMILSPHYLITSSSNHLITSSPHLLVISISGETDGYCRMDLVKHTLNTIITSLSEHDKYEYCTPFSHPE
jgi:hypothetical protein